MGMIKAAGLWLGAVLCCAGLLWWQATPASAARSTRLDATIDVKGTTVVIEGKLVDAQDAPVGGAPVDVTVDDKSACQLVTDDAGAFSCTVTDVGEGSHTGKVLFAGEKGWAPARAEGPFTVKVKQASATTVLTASAPTEGQGGSGVEINGALTDGKGEPVYGVRVVAGINSTSEVDASALTDDNGDYRISLELPRLTAADNVTISVRFEGLGDQPAASRAVTIRVTPAPTPTPSPTPSASASATPTPTPVPSAEPVATPPDAAPLPDAPGPLAFWPLILTGIGALILLGIMAFLARRWHQSRQSEPTDSFEDVSHLDLNR